MAVIAVLNTLVQADTSQFEGKMTRAESAPGKLASKVKDAGRDMKQSISGMGSNISGNLQAALGSVGGQASGMVSRMAGLAAALGPVGVAAGVAAGAIAAMAGSLAMLANRGAESISTLRRLASQAGLTSESMAALSTMSGAGGADGFARAMTTMQKNITNMSGEAVTALARIRLDPSQLRGQSSEAQLRMIANAFANTADHATRTSAAMAIFGDSGAGMVEELSRGAAGLDALAARAQRFGLTFTESQGNAIRNANREWENFGLAIEGISRQAAILFAPMWEAIGKVGGDIGEWLVGAFKEAVPFIQSTAGMIVERFGPAWTAVVGFASTIGAMFRDAMPLIGEIGNLLVAMAESTLAVFTPVRTYQTAFQGIGGSISEAFRIAVTWLKFGVEVAVSWYSAIARVANAIQEWFGGILNTVLQQFFGASTTGWNSVKTFALTTLAVIKVGLDNLKLAWDLAIAGIRLGWLELSRSLGSIMANIATTVRDGLVNPIIAMVRRMIDGLGAVARFDLTGVMAAQINVARAALDGVDRLANGINIGFNGADLDRQIRELRASMRDGAGDFDAQVQALVARWSRELVGGVRNAGREAARAASTVASTTTGRNRAITGNDATLSTSERAFSLIYSTRGHEDYYQRQTAAATAASRTGIERLVRAFEAAPSLRRARI